MAHSIRDDNMLELCSPAEVAITIPSFLLFSWFSFRNTSIFGDTDFAMQTLPVAERCGRVYTPGGKRRRSDKMLW